MPMLAFRTYGEVTNPALVFLHGFLGCKEDWNEIAKHLESKYFCVCIDLPGHGESVWHHDPIDALKNTLESFPLKEPSALGYSLGGRILLEWQNRMPEQFSSCFFLSSHPGLTSELTRQERRKKEEQWIHLLQTTEIAAFLEKWYEQPLFTSLKNNKELFSTMILKRKEQNISSLLKVYETFRLSNQTHFDTFSSPSFFFYGEYDTAYRDLYLNKNWNAVIEKISQSGHAMHIENPEECAQRIQRCLQLKCPH